MLLYLCQGHKGRGFPSGRGPAALRGRGSYQYGGEAAQAGNGNQVQKAAAIELARLPPKVQAEEHRERRVSIVACWNAEGVRDGLPLRLGRQMIETRGRGIRLECTRRGVHAPVSLCSHERSTYGSLAPPAEATHATRSAMTAAAPALRPPQDSSDEAAAQSSPSMARPGEMSATSVAASTGQAAR